MRPRILINLAFFAILGVVMTIWAFTSIIKLDVLTRPYRVDAEFVSSPGLSAGFEVAYLGVRVGKVGDVRLAPGKIIVGMDLDRDVRLPRGVSAEVRRKSAIGEPYVEMSPPKTSAGGGTLAAGDVIPLAKTSVPLDYKKLFDGVGKLLNAIPPDDAHTIVHELSTGLSGRAESIQGIIDDAHELTGTLADNAALLDDLSVQLTRLTGTLAGRREKLASGISDLYAVTGALRQSRQDLNRFLDKGPGVFRQIDYLLQTARPGLSCLLTAAGEPTQAHVFTPETQQHIHHLLSIVPTALALADDITDRRPEGTYGRATFIFSVPGGPQVAAEYASPLKAPAPPPLRHCPAPPKGNVQLPSWQDTGDPAVATGDGGVSPRPTAAGTGDRTGPRKNAGGPATPEPAVTAPAGGTTALVIMTLLAVALAGGVIGWIAVGRGGRAG
jgi:phospholipid/cholesterol/gamma-HCH transport system substrate-binding protein